MKMFLMMCDRPSGGSDVGDRFRFFVWCLAFCTLALLGEPLIAYGADYACSEVDLTAQVETDGKVSVIDQRTFDLDEKAHGRTTLKWLYDGFIEGATITIESVRMAPADAEGSLIESWTEVPETPFLLPWRDGGGPDQDGWAYDRFQSTLYVYAGNLPDRVLFEVTYRVEDAIEAFDDAADFQWLYAPQDYGVALTNVKAEVVLPVASGDTVRAGDNVYAWGHGPASGTVDIRLDGTAIFEDPEIPPNMYAFARVMFPVQWLSNLSEADRLANQGTLQYYWTSRYEETWVDTDTSRKIIRLGLATSLVGLAAILLGAGVLVWWRWGRDKMPDFRGDYWMEVPAESMAPAVLGRLWRWNHESSDDVVATVLDMARRGVLTIENQCVYFPSELNVQETMGDKNSSRCDFACNDEEILDGATLKLLARIAPESCALSPQHLADFVRDRPRDFLDAHAAWQRTLTNCVEPHDFFDRRSRRAQRAVLIVALVLAVLSLVTVIFVDWKAGLLGLVAAGAMGVLGNYTMRRSSEANNIAAHAKALRNWMRDGGWVIESPMLSPAEQAELIPYGFLFGVLSCLGPVKGEAGRLASCAPKLSTALNDALRMAYQQAEVS